jgi:hypothetical protein
MMARRKLCIDYRISRKLAFGLIVLLSCLAISDSEAFSQWALHGSARAVGLAGAYGSASGELDGIGYNPSCMAGINAPRMFGTAEGLRYEGGAFGLPLRGLAVGVGVEYQGLESLEFGAERPELFRGAIYVAREVGSRIRFGAGLGGVRGTIGDETADGFQLDAGLQAEVMDGLTMGLSYTGLGSEVYFESDADSSLNLLDPRALAGVAWEKSFYRIGADVSVPDEGSTEMRLGAEVSTPWDLYLRSGAIILEDNEDVVPYSFGLGYGIGDYSIDYAFLSWDDESYHRLSASFALTPPPSFELDPPVATQLSYPSNMSIAESTIRGAVEEIVRKAGVPEGCLVYIKETQGGEGAWLVENIFVELLTNGGHVVKVGSAPTSQLSDDDGSEGDSAAVYNLTYRIPSMGVEYQRGWREHFVGKKYVERSAHAKLYARVAEPNGEILWAGEAERSYIDVVPAEFLPELETDIAGFQAAEMSSGGWDEIVEPVIVSGIVGGLIYLFYTSKSTD